MLNHTSYTDNNFNFKEDESPWDVTRESFTDWVAEFGTDSGILDKLQWRGFPIWWASKLILKDTEVDFQWYVDLHDRLNGRRNSAKRRKGFLSMAVSMFSVFFLDMIKFLLVKAILPKQDTDIQGVCFFSYYYNIIHADTAFDRQYSTVPLKDKEFSERSIYLIALNINSYELLHVFSLAKKLKGLSRKLQRDVVFLDKLLKFQDLLSIHYINFKNFIKFRHMFSRERAGHRFVINGSDCYDILAGEFESSFLGYLQRTLSMAAMVENFLNKANKPLVFVTYGEVLAANRPIYYFGKHVNSDNQFVSIQHATSYRNKLGFYHRKTEFADSVNSSAGPDYYLVHGRKYYDILSEYYPRDRIEIIGCLKYDSLFRVVQNKDWIRDKIHALVDGKTNKFILLAPSVNDVRDILAFFEGITLPSGWRVIMSLHPVINIDKTKEIIAQLNLSFQVEFFPVVKSIELITISDIVICGYSSIALEAAVLGVRSMRIIPSDRPPLTEDEEGVIYCHTQADFAEEINNIFTAKTTPCYYPVAEEYFSSIDGKVFERFWVNVVSIKKSIKSTA